VTLMATTLLRLPAPRLYPRCASSERPVPCFGKLAFFNVALRNLDQCINPNLIVSCFVYRVCEGRRFLSLLSPERAA
jgi:hypothetical protein